MGVVFDVLSLAFGIAGARVCLCQIKCCIVLLLQVRHVE